MLRLRRVDSEHLGSDLFAPRWARPAGAWNCKLQSESNFRAAPGAINTPRGLPSLCVPQLPAPRRNNCNSASRKRIKNPKHSSLPSVDAVKASKASAKLSADSAVSALEATKLILARAESLEDSAKKADSLN